MDDDYNSEKKTGEVKDGEKKQDSKVDFTECLPAKEIIELAAKPISAYHIRERMMRKCQKEHHREMTRDEWKIIYDVIRNFRRSHDLNVKTGRKRQREVSESKEQRYIEQQT